MPPPVRDAYRVCVGRTCVKKINRAKNTSEHSVRSGVINEMKRRRLTHVEYKPSELRGGNLQYLPLNAAVPPGAIVGRLVGSKRWRKARPGYWGYDIRVEYPENLATNNKLHAMQMRVL